MHRILLVEDEKNFATVLKDYLKMNGFDVELRENGEEGLQAFKASAFDLCILDIMMPKKDGFTLAAEIRSLNKRVPLLFLTARGLRDDVIKGYKLGADDYLTKPFDPEVLLLKLNAVLSRGNNPNSLARVYGLGHYTFNAGLRTLTSKAGVQTRLSPKETALLQLLCQHQNDVLPREKALKLIWKEDTYFTARSMDVYIVKLRKYLAADTAIEIVNLHGNGYSLRTPV